MDCSGQIKLAGVHAASGAPVRIPRNARNELVASQLLRLTSPSRSPQHKSSASKQYLATLLSYPLTLTLANGHTSSVGKRSASFPTDLAHQNCDLVLGRDGSAIPNPRIFSPAVSATRPRVQIRPHTTLTFRLAACCPALRHTAQERSLPPSQK